MRDPRRNMDFGVRDGFDLPAAPERRQPGEPVRMLLRNQSRELAIASGRHSRKTPDGREPDRRLPRRRLACAPRGPRHGVHLHPIVAGASGLLCLHGTAPLAFKTASASFRKSPDRVDASPHSWGRTVFVQRPWPLSLRRPAPEPRPSLTGCALPKPTRPAPSGACTVSGRLSPCAAVLQKPRFAAQRASPAAPSHQ